MPNQSHPLINSEPKTLVKTLEPFLTTARKTRIEDVIKARLQSLHLAIEAPSDIHNALAAIRSAEAFGIYNIHIISPEGNISKNNGVTKGSAYWVQTHYYDELSEFLDFIRRKDFLLAGAILETSQKLSDLPINKNLCLLFGNEHRGLSQKAQDHCDFLFKIPMVGMVESFNLSVAAAISLYDLSTRKRAFLSGKPDLNEKAEQELRAQYYLQSVDQRLAHSLLKKF